MNVFTLYERSTGRFSTVWWGDASYSIEANTNADVGAITGEHDADTHYVLDGQLVERPASPVTRTDLTLHDVPNGATLFINGESYAAEGTVGLEFPLPGTYQLRVECFPFLDWTDEVTV